MYFPIHKPISNEMPLVGPFLGGFLCAKFTTHVQCTKDAVCQISEYFF